MRDSKTSILDLVKKLGSSLLRFEGCNVRAVPVFPKVTASLVPEEVSDTFELEEEFDDVGVLVKFIFSIPTNWTEREPIVSEDCFEEDVVSNSGIVAWGHGVEIVVSTGPIMS